MAKYGVVAKLVWDGGDEVLIPSEMGTPASNQMKGTAIERLSEVSCRVCYDSLGKGRSSEELHKHILEVKHLSVYGHGAVTVKFNCNVDYTGYLNRPGVWVERYELIDAHRVTLNARALLDWDYWTSFYKNRDQRISADWLKRVLMVHVGKLCPQILHPKKEHPEFLERISEITHLTEPEVDEEKWISLFLSGSRGFSHEQVRHGFRTGISQRSTRYVDEDGSPWLDHPLVQEFLASTDAIPEDPDNRIRGAFSCLIEDTKAMARRTYGHTVDVVQKWLLRRGVDKFTARKQARGAARGYLGNALVTELVFSASVEQWKRILRQRCTAPADAEIRAVIATALPELKASRYGDSFSNFSLVPAGDGMGECAVETAPTV